MTNIFAVSMGMFELVSVEIGKISQQEFSFSLKRANWA